MAKKFFALFPENFKKIPCCPYFGRHGTENVPSSFVFELLLSDENLHHQRVGQQFGERVRRLGNKAGNYIVSLFLHRAEGLFYNEGGVVHTVKVRDDALFVGAVEEGGLCPVGAYGEHADIARAEFPIDGAGERKHIGLGGGVFGAERNGLEGGDAGDVDDHASLRAVGEDGIHHERERAAVEVDHSRGVLFGNAVEALEFSVSARVDEQADDRLFGGKPFLERRYAALGRDRQVGPLVRKSP